MLGLNNKTNFYSIPKKKKDREEMTIHVFVSRNQRKILIL